jgi:hypothetical protein
MRSRRNIERRAIPPLVTTVELDQREELGALRAPRRSRQPFANPGGRAHLPHWARAYPELRDQIPMAARNGPRSEVLAVQQVCGRCARGLQDRSRLAQVNLARADNGCPSHARILGQDLELPPEFRPYDPRSRPRRSGSGALILKVSAVRRILWSSRIKKVAPMPSIPQHSGNES